MGYIQDMIRSSYWKNMPEDIEDRVVYILGIIGPSHPKEIGHLAGKGWTYQLRVKMVNDGRIIILRERPILLGLPDDKLYYSD